MYWGVCIHKVTYTVHILYVLRSVLHASERISPFQHFLRHREWQTTIEHLLQRVDLAIQQQTPGMTAHSGVETGILNQIFQQKLEIPVQCKQSVSMLAKRIQTRKLLFM